MRHLRATGNRSCEKRFLVIGVVYMTPMTVALSPKTAGYLIGNSAHVAWEDYSLGRPATRAAGRSGRRPTWGVRRRPAALRGRRRGPRRPRRAARRHHAS